MISEEQRARIRRLFFAEHWTVGTIAKSLGVHHQTVRTTVGVERFSAARVQPRATQLDPYKAFILATLEEYPRLRSTRLHEMVKSRGYPGSARCVRRFVEAIRPRAKAEAYFRLTTLPGEQAQVDWAHFGKIRVGHAERALSCFVMVLSYSRAVYARFALDQTLESFLLGHILGFEAFGGAPREILYDNLKSVVLDRVGEHIRFHPRLLELCGHYHFAPKPCAPYRGNEKGKVERTIQYLRHSFFAARRFDSVVELNGQLTDWIASVANARLVPEHPEKITVAVALQCEQPKLLPLPKNRFECDVVRPISSGKTPYIRFDRNDYSIPHTLVRRPLTLVASETNVRVLDGLTCVAQHPRSYDHAQRIEAAAHLAELTAQKRHAHELRNRDRLRNQCPNVEKLLEALAMRGEPLRSQTTQLLRLLDRHGAEQLVLAIDDALQRGAIHASSVAHILDQRQRARGASPPCNVVLPDDPRVRDLRVTPHALAGYDALYQSDEQENPDANQATSRRAKQGHKPDRENNRR
jgi:transposase